MAYRTLFPFVRAVQATNLLKKLLYQESTQYLLLHANFSAAAQWIFSQDELELLALYSSEGRMRELRDTFLVERDGNYYSKGSHYFKEYNKRYGQKMFTEFASYIGQCINKEQTRAFDDEDQGLKAKVLLVLAEELVNHLAWATYLSYQAAGVRRSFSHSVTPTEMHVLRECLLLANRVYLSLLAHPTSSPGRYLEAIEAHLVATPIKFIGGVASTAGRGPEGHFFRERLGSNEVANALYALALRAHFQEQKIVPDAIVAPYYHSLTAAAFVHSALCEANDKLQLMVHVYNSGDDHVRSGEWHGKERRAIAERIAQIPPLARPEQNVSGKKLVVVGHSSAEIASLAELAHFYRQLGATEVRIATVAADSEGLLFAHSPLSHKNTEICFAPITFELSPAELRACKKHAGQFSPRHPR